MKEGATPAPSNSSQCLCAQLLKRSTLLRTVRAKEKVKRVSGPKNLPQEVSGRAHRRDRMLRATASRGRRLKKQEGQLKNEERQMQKQEWRKGQKQGERPHLLRVRRIGHPARLCPSEGWVNDLEQDARDGEDTNEGVCWTEGDDETFQLVYFGSDSCLTSSPPGLRDACSEAGWTVVTRQSGNRQQCSRRRGCFDKRGTVLGSLWDDDNDMVLEQVADDRTKKGMVKISADVESGAEANALPENMMQWIPMKPSSASKSGKIFRGAGGDPILARGERSVTGRTDE